MHYHCEIIMPPSTNISEDVEKILAPFSEHLEDNGGTPSFFDWYVIGGRWAGIKETCAYDADKMEEFYQLLRDNNITVSGMQAGKQEISPASQIPIVDKLWADMFPTENGEIVACPLFSHSNNQYDSNDLLGCDISLLADVPSELKCSRVIIAGPDYNDEISVQYMISDDVWNGINFMDVDWDGKIQSAINKFTEKLENYRDDYRKKVTPKPNWICVTVDYHC